MNTLKLRGLVAAVEKGTSVALVALMGMLSYLVLPVTASAAELTGEITSMSTPQTGATATYTLTIGGVSAANIQCVQIEFEDTAIGSGTLPTGMVITPAAITPSGTLGITGSWTESNPNAWTYRVTDGTGATPTAGTKTIILAGITNSSVANTTYYTSVNTFSDTGCTAAVDSNGLSTFVNTAGVLVDATVNPTLTFTVDNTTCPLGVLTASSTGTCGHTMTAATNGVGGYSISYISASTLTSGVPTITALSSAGTSTVGVEQFGLHLAVAGPGTGTVAATYVTPTYKFVPSSVEQVATAAGASALNTYTVTYIANITNTTEAGLYTMTQTYNITATY